MSDRVTVYKSGEKPRQVWTIDSHDYLIGGWSFVEPVAEPEPEPAPVRTRKSVSVSEAE